MRFWALNLPQFYETPENNEWWGKGYTEWTSVRNAKPLYKGHEQPLVPLNKYYYDLSQKETIQWQAELAKKYGIEGFVYYHYWYEGRHLLEKPCEMLLESSEIDIKYCFCWANHSWTRAWDGKNHEILVEQTYGDLQEWEKHFQYLKRFWCDKRYLRMEDKPVLFIYKPNDIRQGDERINYYNKRLVEEGISTGLYVVEYISSFNTKPSLKSSQAVYEDEPNYTCRFEISAINKAKRVLCKSLKITDYQNYDNLWKLIIKKSNTYDGRKIILGGFPRWDNSPRKGKNSRVIRGATPAKFRKYISMLVKTKRQDSSGILLVNAWNEWGEGAILEPTELDGYGYLEVIKDFSEEDKNE
jgi:lipopolysaccharide biosynthesis protein